MGFKNDYKHMRTTALLMFLIFIAASITSNKILGQGLVGNNYVNSDVARDSSGVYFTKTDFLNNLLEFKTSHKIRITSRPFWTNFSVNEEAVPVKITLDNGEKKTLAAGSFYGFKTEGVKFVYVNYYNEYPATLNDTEPLYLFVRKKIHFSGTTAFSDDYFYFSKNIDDSLKEFNIENIRAAFGNNVIVTESMIKLLKAIKENGFDGEMHKKQFFDCEKLVKSYLSKKMTK
jgi:hypothetical protein